MNILASTYTTPSGVFIKGIDESKRCQDGYFYYVYCIVNLITKRLYIGKRSSINLRESYVGSGTAIRGAVKKYGKENFARHILEYTDSPEKLRELEIFYIKEVFGAHRNDVCYNLCIDSGKPMNGRKMSESTKEKLRKLNTGKKISDETKIKIGLAGLNRKDSDETRLKKSLGAKGRIISQEQREKIRETLKKRWKQDNSWAKIMREKAIINIKKANDVVRNKGKKNKKP